MKLTRWNIAGPLADDLRARAGWAAVTARNWAQKALSCPAHVRSQYARTAARHARRALALRAAADRIERS